MKREIIINKHSDNKYNGAPVLTMGPEKPDKRELSLPVKASPPRRCDNGCVNKACPWYDQKMYYSVSSEERDTGIRVFEMTPSEFTTRSGCVSYDNGTPAPAEEPMYGIMEPSGKLIYGSIEPDRELVEEILSEFPNPEGFTVVEVHMTTGPIQPPANPFTDKQFGHLAMRLNECRCDTCKEISRVVCDLYKGQPGKSNDNFAVKDELNRVRFKLLTVGFPKSVEDVINQVINSEIEQQHDQPATPGKELKI